MTVLYQLGDDPSFDRCLPDTLKEEGPDAANLRDARNYSNDPHEKGGATMDGIIQREYDKLRLAQGLPTRWVKNIDPQEVRTIYRAEYSAIFRASGNRHVKATEMKAMSHSRQCATPLIHSPLCQSVIVR
jgi:hypothetical protein